MQMSMHRLKKTENSRPLLSLGNLFSILATLPDPAFILTRTGRYAEVFGGKDHRYYHDGSGLVGKSISDVLADEKASMFIDEIGKALDSRALCIIEYCLGRADVKGLESDGPDEPLWFEGRVQALDLLVDGEEAVIWVASNITEKYSMQQKLLHMCETDALTGLFNRRKLLETLDERLEILRRDGTPTSVLIFDIDRFKRINDEGGHHVGDEMLVKIADICRHHLRDADLAARLGGDEFVLVMPAKNKEAALVNAECFRGNVPIMLGQSLSREATISGGLSDMRLSDRCTEDVLKRADAGLYVSKRAGRNRVSAR